ncbi:MAG TPA: hypothetical protein VLK89_08585 [Solirubrobacterales bacterium]|nr:hypothetical protein [Solirubrobacterales bacterium]
MKSRKSRSRSSASPMTPPGSTWVTSRMVETDKRVEFFSYCVKHEAVDAKSGRVYYFKLKEPSEEISALYDTHLNPALWEPWWSEYLVAKYEAMTLFNEDEGRALDEVIAQVEGIDGDYADIVESWRSLGPQEALVYRLRVEQVGDLQTVRDTWYDEFPSFDRWVASCGGERLITADDPEVSELVWSKIDDTLNAALRSPGVDAKAREGVAALHASRSAIADRLQHELPEHLYVVGKGGVSPVDEVAVEIATVTLNLLAQRQRQLGPHVEAVMNVIKARFSASVVDFLLLRRRLEVEELEFLSATGEVTEGMRTKLESEASYPRPVGITGAILVAQPDHELFHVGTNQLASDPRQSPSHRSAYEELYGPLENFWVFPVHLGDELLGALRVVNRLDKEDAVVGWPFAQRQRLVGLMKFVGALWTACAIEVPVDDVEGPPEHIAEQVKTASEQCLNSAEALSLESPGKVTGEALAAVLGALAAFSEVRIEKRKLRGTALVVAAERIMALENGALGERFEALSRVPPLVEMDHASSRDGNVLVIRSDGRIAGRIAGTGNQPADIHGLAAQCSAEFLLQINAERERLVEVWKGPNHVADYAFATRSGVWRLRRFSLPIEEISRRCRFDAKLLGELLERARRLSYDGHGTIIALWDGSVLPREIEDIGEEVERPVATISDADFVDYASKDGGCIVSGDGTLKFSGIKFPSAPAKLADAEAAADFQAARQMLRDSQRGTRHEGALSGSTHLPDAVVLCASENRTICAFVNGEAIVWDH